MPELERAINTALQSSDLHSYLYGAGALVSDGVLVDGWRIYYRGTLGSGGNPALPARLYMMFGEEQSLRFQVVKETSSAQVRSFKFYLYDDPLGVTRINAVAPLVDQTCLGLLGQQLPGGGRCMDVDLGSWGRVESDSVQGLLVRSLNCNFVTSSNN